MADRQITARVDEGLHARCAAEAKARGMTLEAFAGKLVAEGVEQLIPAADFRLTRPALPAAPDLTPAAEVSEVDAAWMVCEGSREKAAASDVPGGILPVWRCPVCGIPVGTDVDDDGIVWAKAHAGPGRIPF